DGRLGGADGGRLSVRARRLHPRVPARGARRDRAHAPRRAGHLRLRARPRPRLAETGPGTLPFTGKSAFRDGLVIHGRASGSMATTPCGGCLAWFRATASSRRSNVVVTGSVPSHVPVMSSRPGFDHLALHEVEELVVELAEALRRQRAAVRALEVLQHPLLAGEVDEPDAVLLLVPLQLRDEPQPLVHELDERGVEIRDLTSHVADERIRRGRDVRAHEVILAASYTPTTRCERVSDASSSSAPRTAGSSGCPATTASKR